MTQDTPRFSLSRWREYVFPAQDHLPRDLTTADWLKAFAVILMLCDHIGYYLFSDIEWFRVIGRPGMPVWFFLVGYARRQDLPMRWIVAGIVLVVANILVGMDPIPLNALFTLAACRLIVGPLWRFLENNPIYFWWIIFLLLFLGPVSGLLSEYGTFGILFAAIGYAMRRREEVAAMFSRDPAMPLFVLVGAVFIVFQIMHFAFTPLAAMVMAAGMAGVLFCLWGFENRTLPGTADNPQAPLVRFMGRYTLEIYVIHLLILKAVLGLQKLAAIIIR